MCIYGCVLCMCTEYNTHTIHWLLPLLNRIKSLPSSLFRIFLRIVDLQNCIKDALAHDKEMLSSGKLLRKLTESEYFKEEGQFNWPESFKPMLSDHDTLGLTPKDEYDLALNAMGGVVWCLEKCLIDQELLSMRQIVVYNPVENSISSSANKDQMKKEFLKQKYMVKKFLVLGCYIFRLIVKIRKRLINITSCKIFVIIFHYELLTDASHNERSTRFHLSTTYPTNFYKNYL